jgi:hypothetical protein
MLAEAAHSEGAPSMRAVQTLPVTCRKNISEQAWKQHIRVVRWPRRDGRSGTSTSVLPVEREDDQAWKERYIWSLLLQRAPCGETRRLGAAGAGG